MKKISIENCSGIVLQPFYAVKTKIDGIIEDYPKEDKYSFQVSIMPQMNGKWIDIEFKNLTEKEFGQLIQSMNKLQDILGHAFKDVTGKEYTDEEYSDIIDFDNMLSYNEAAIEQENNATKSLIDDIRAPFKKYKT